MYLLIPVAVYIGERLVRALREKQYHVTIAKVCGDLINIFLINYSLYSS